MGLCCVHTMNGYASERYDTATSTHYTRTATCTSCGDVGRHVFGSTDGSVTFA